MNFTLRVLMNHLAQRDNMGTCHNVNVGKFGYGCVKLSFSVQENRMKKKNSGLALVLRSSALFSHVRSNDVTEYGAALLTGHQSEQKK